MGVFIDLPSPPAVTIVMPDVCQTEQKEARFSASGVSFPKPPQELPKENLKKGESRQMFYYNLVVRGVKPCDEKLLLTAQN